MMRLVGAGVAATGTVICSLTSVQIGVWGRKGRIETERNKRCNLRETRASISLN